MITLEVIPDRVNPTELSLLRGRVDAITIPALRNESGDPSYPDRFHVTPQQRSIACAFLVKRLGLEAVASVTCRDCRKDELQNLSRLGVERLENVLAVYGDPCGPGRDVYEFSTTDQLIRDITSNCESMSVGAITNQYARSRESEVQRTLSRVDAGADFVLTNTVLDEDLVLEHRDGLLSAGLDVPLLFQVSIPHSLENLLYVSRKFRIPVPERLARRFGRASLTGIEFAAGMFESLKTEANGVHFSYLLRRRDPIQVYSRLLDRIRAERVPLSVPARIAQMVR